MASLWNFVTRLTSRRRQAPQQSLPAPDIVSKPDPVMLLAAEAIADDAALLSQSAQSGAVVEGSDKPVAAVELAAALVAKQATDAAYPAVIAGGDDVAAPPRAQPLLPAAKARTSRRQNSKAGRPAARRPVTNAPAGTSQAISLHDEITLLRRALIGKLRLQNAELETMLKRFDQ